VKVGEIENRKEGERLRGFYTPPPERETGRPPNVPLWNIFKDNQLNS